MNDILMDGSVTEQTAGQDFVYLLNNEENLISGEYEVVAAEENSIFLKCMYGSYNGQNSLYYATEGYVPVTTLLPMINESAFLKIVKDFLGAVIAVKNCVELKENHIVISLSKIYVKHGMEGVKITYLPMVDGNDGKADDFEMEMRKVFANIMRNTENVRGEKTFSVANSFSDPNISIEILYSMMGGNLMNMIKAGIGFGRSISSGIEKAPVNAEVAMPKIRLENLNGNIPDIVVDSEDYVIGRSPDISDCAILEAAVSRIHCKVSKIDDKIAVLDLGSANGTYVNGSRLIPNQPHFISDNDVLRIANSDFLIKFPEEYIEYMKTLEPVAVNSMPVEREIRREEKRTKLLMVHSASGGTGKTTIALGLSNILAFEGVRVLYICTSSYQSFNNLLQDKVRIKSSNIAACENLDDLNGYLGHAAFDYIPEIRRNGLSDKSGISSRRYINIIEMVLNSGRYDLVIVDTESTINNLNRYLIEKSDQVIMVTKQSGIEYGGTVRFAEMIRNVAAGKVIYVINDYDKYSFDASGESGGFDRVDISDYIEHFRNIDALYCTDLSKCPELVKLAGKIIV